MARVAVLHGSWVEDDNGGRFTFWGEWAHEQFALPAGDDRFPPYPYALGSEHSNYGYNRHGYSYGYYDPTPPKELTRLVEWGLAEQEANLYYQSRARRVQMFAALPDGEHLLAGWQVAGLTINAGDALTVLNRIASLPLPKDVNSPGQLPTYDDSHVQTRFDHIGADLLFWSAAARLVRELLVSGGYIPAVSYDNESWRSVWQAATDNPDSVTKIARLIAAMPPACRALAATEQELIQMLDGQPPSAEAMLHRFLDGMIDGVVRQAVKGDYAIRPTASGEALRWVKSLYSLQPYIHPNENSPIVSGYARWRGIKLDAATRYRVMLRLEPPAEPGVDEGELDRDEWQLIFLLQSLDDPSLQIPAALVWHAQEQLPAELLPIRARQQILAALGKAVTAFPPLARYLPAADPSHIILTVDEAYALLHRSLDALEQGGLHVIVPGWWLKQPKLSAHLSLQAEGNEPSGFFSVESLVRYDWQVAIGDAHLDPAEFARLAQLKQPLVRVKGQWVELSPTEREAILKLVKQNGKRVGLGEAVRLAIGGLHEPPGDFADTRVRVSGWLKRLFNSLDDGKLEDLPQPASFVGELRPYQVRGYSWLAFLRRYGLGACLADDMGLGKTVQLLTLLLREQEANASGPTLLICPTSVVGNWQREAARFTPSLKVMVHHGAARRKGEDFVAEAKTHDLVISSYSLLARDEPLLAEVGWRTVALDEAQNIKNHNTKQSRAVRRIPAAHRIALTGTPVENRLAELWSIMDFLNPSYLGSSEQFQHRYARPIERVGDQPALSQLRKITAPFVLRRLKSDPRIIQDLPDKNEMKVYCNLTVEQATLYQAFVQEMMAQIERSDGITRRGLVLKMLLRLKQLCNHPAHFLGDQSKLEGRSGKLARLSEMLEEALQEGDKALIFTQFAEMGAMLQTYLQERFGSEVLYLYGGTERSQRERMIDRFQAGPPTIFVLSLKAGGLGLNLTAANHVFHFDRWWNPAVENQATDRAYRIGQTRNVQVHKFICVGTLEERIDALIESKKALAESVIGGDSEGWLTELSTADLREVVRLSAEAIGD